MLSRFSISPVVAMAAALVMVAPTAVLANEPTDESGWHEGRWQESPTHQTYRGETPRHAYYSPAQNAWLADCRQRISASDRGVGGAVIGGLVGGVAGNRIAGQGNRTVGTLAGAAIGATAGTIIDRAENGSRARDECEAYLDDYYARYEGDRTSQRYTAYAHTGPANASGYPGYYPANPYGGCCGPFPVTMVPISVQPAPQCTETIEYVYEDVPVKKRVYRSKAVKTNVAGDKRVHMTTGKRVTNR